MENQKLAEVGLRKTGHVKKIFNFKVSWRGEELKDHFKIASQTLPSEVREILKIILRYLDAPLIIDDFSSHKERVVWRDQVLFLENAEACSFYKENKLRYSNTAYMLTVPGLLANLNQRLEKELDPSLVQRANNLLDSYPPEVYQNLSHSEAEKFVDEVVGIMVDLYLNVFRAYNNQNNQ